MQLAPGADAVGLAALASHLVDIALDERGSPEGNFQGMLQVLQKTAQDLAQATEVRKFFYLHFNILYRIQINRCQEKNHKPYAKMFFKGEGKLYPDGFSRGTFLLSELQVPCLHCRLHLSWRPIGKVPEQSQYKGNRNSLILPIFFHHGRQGRGGSATP
jgi:hypothetical protein